MGDYEFPRFYSFPPFFTLQPNEETRANQVSAWRNFILGYCAAHNVSQLEIQSALDSPLCHNAAIDRKLSEDALRLFIDDLVATRNAEWLTSDHTTALIMPATPDEVAAAIYDWIDTTGQIGDVLTVYELHSGDTTVGTSFHGLDAVLINRALDVLASQGKAKVFSASSPEDAGVKFFPA
ncbi:vacuolar protein-sorting-associated protein 25 [Thecamonas trahens ATCC 50062]|uniref:Vacuolar protein-sorting-associated protein 25 n=1 Tax=Thecamonas trahens ATCC 50062 TaxID=461836 RepID=A0A0L0DRW0_THETB|nr:vacuolar protein-sorting-associated protein 25 [Thecamonas trahens ATCC 50062]KNC54761.1 vacuolar protein-sorting-associated protein 25 [Thecamonas trahens ATCC 50062]|eukprot:XP_013761661.1 vacuolar protein-sorting-associated protein 25 [Thecamonas trahens ATCC 50062]